MQRKVDCDRIVMKVRRKNFRAAMIRARREISEAIVPLVKDSIAERVLKDYAEVPRILIG